jgi:hypothetical protein
MRPSHSASLRRLLSRKREGLERCPFPLDPMGETGRIKIMKAGGSFTHRWRVLFFLPAVALLLFSGCASVERMSGFLDDHYKALSRNIADVVDATDKAFGEPRIEDREQIVRVKVGLESKLREGGTRELKPKLNARIPLPATARRFNIFIEFTGDTETSGEYGDLGTGRYEDSYSATATMLKQLKDRDIEFGTKFGAHWKDSPGFFIKPFLRWDKRKDPWGFFIDQSVYYDTNDGFGTRTAGHIDYILTKVSYLRFFSAAETYQEIDGGWDLEHALIYRRPFFLGSILSTEGWVLYNPGYIKDDKAYVRMRWIGRIWRPWLEYEVQPRIEWKREDDFASEFMLIMALHIYFEDYLGREPGRESPMFQEK